MSVGSEVTSVLMMTGLHPRDAKTVISCIAHNNQMQVPPSASVTLDIVLGIKTEQAVSCLQMENKLFQLL